MELWDVYDNNRKKTGRMQERGKPLAAGEFHLVVSSWIVNADGEFLISKRHPEKKHPNLWECPGGSVLAGENSLQGALRETKEEIGIDLSRSQGEIIFSTQREHDFYDAWLFRASFNIEEIILQKEEVTDARWATAGLIKRLINAGQFVPSLRYFSDIF